MKQYTLTDLRTFIAVVESGSFNKAADRLDTSSASVSRRISALEEALDTRLLNRTTRLLHLTDTGRQFFNDIRNVLGALQESEDRLRDDGAALRGNLRLSAPMSFGIQTIAPLLPEFLQHHPNLHIDLQLEDKQTDLYAEGIDLALRIGKLNDSSLIATKLCDIEFGYYASPDYLQQHGQPSRLEALSDHQCLHYSLTSHAQEWGLQDYSINLQGALSANNGEVLCEAAIQGLGIIALPRFIVEEALTKGKLQAILCDFAPKPTGLYALRLSRRFTPAKVRLTIEYLKDRLQGLQIE